MDNICCIINFDGFNVNRKFLVREFGWVNVDTGKAGNVHFDLQSYNGGLTDKDRNTIRFSTRNLHGMPFLPIRGEEVVPHDLLKSKLQEVYDSCQDGDKNIVAYKGGNAEKDLLVKLKIPFVNLEEFGCRKYAELNKYHTSANCGFHQNSLPCSLAQVVAYRSWILDNKHEFTDNSNEDD